MTKSMNVNVILTSMTIFCLLMGCQTARPEISRGVIYNHTPMTIRDVSLEHRSTGKTVSTSSILAGRVFSLGFPARMLPTGEAVLHWREGITPRMRTLTIPNAGPDAKDLVLIYEIRPLGEVDVRLSSTLPQ